MKKATKTQAEKLKQNIEAVSEKSKENIRSIIDSTSKQFESALDANKKYIESLEKQFFGRENYDGEVVSEVRKTFNNSVELSEEAIDTIIDIQSDQLQSAIDMNMRLVEAIRGLDISAADEAEELFRVIEKNFEESSSQSIENTKKITEIYNKHLNLALNFNERMAKNVQSQFQVLNKFQNKNADLFNNWVTQWWKSASREEVEV